ncbi:Hsp20 family protein [Salmonella enterica]|uniref:Hsp20 family protein n=1 Tax=Salmonella enterica TaxID=28901 RepID=UPI000EFB1F0B
MLQRLTNTTTVSFSLFSDRFNRIDRLFSQLTGDTPVAATPAYDLQKRDANNYLLTVSVPGWKEEERIYRGIRKADFQLSFSLPEHAKVNNAKLEQGLLLVEIYQEIPESEKPKKIAIESKPKAIEHKS